MKKPANHEWPLPSVERGKAAKPVAIAETGNGAPRQGPIESSSGLHPAGIAKTAFIFAMAAFFILLAVRRLTPPPGLSAASPAADFSSERAMRHLRVIATKPHPMGSSEHDDVREYIRGMASNLGLIAEVQRNPVISNVMVRLNGTAKNGPAIALVGHYDTVPLSPGASDDGYGVATLLETMRALKTGAPLKNDVIFLFTDGEEKGLLGAKAFVYDHPWSQDVKLVLNFDARGNNGSMLMFQTSDQNKWLVEQFGKAAPSPVATSLMADIYRAMPNDTDFTIFKNAGAMGLNFACIGGFDAYHKQSDSLDNSDERTLQHAGSYALSLARHFGDLDLGQAAQGRAVYFDILALALIFYSEQWVVPLAVFAGLFFTGIVTVGVLRKRLTLAGAACGFLLFLLSIIGVVVVVTVVQSIVGTPQSWLGAAGRINAWRYNLYLSGLVALAVGTALGIYSWAGKSVGVSNLTVGGLLGYLLLMTFSAFYLPGGSYLFTWPLLFGLVALGCSVSVKDPESVSWVQVIVFSASAVPGIILLVPIAYLLLDALTLQWSAMAVTVTILALGVLVPLACRLFPTNQWLLPAGTSLAGFGLIASSYLRS
jgi:hypothetical protein